MTGYLRMYLVYVLVNAVVAAAVFMGGGQPNPAIYVALALNLAGVAWESVGQDSRTVGQRATDRFAGRGRP